MELLLPHDPAVHGLLLVEPDVVFFTVLPTLEDNFSLLFVAWHLENIDVQKLQDLGADVQLAALE